MSNINIVTLDEKKLPTITHEADICVVGGGLAGLLAAISAARLVLVQVRRPDRGREGTWSCCLQLLPLPSATPPHQALSLTPTILQLPGPRMSS